MGGAKDLEEATDGGQTKVEPCDRPPQSARQPGCLSNLHPMS